MWIKELATRLTIRAYRWTTRLLSHAHVEPRLTAAFHQLYYESYPRTWHNTFFLNVPVLKCPLDLWMYQELIVRATPDLIIECGTRYGGSALFLASICELLNHGQLVTIDIAPSPHRPSHPRITYLTGSSLDLRIHEQLQPWIDHSKSRMVILDSDHRAHHVAQELETFSKIVTPG